MRTTFLLAFLILVFSACKKDKFTTAPQISYKSISPIDISFSTNAIPILTFSITDAEGDLDNTAYIYITNKLTNRFDSLPFPIIQSSSKKDFKADVEVELNLGHNCTPVSNVTDSIYYEIYVKDAAKNKSNIITTTDPVLYRCF